MPSFPVSWPKQLDAKVRAVLAAGWKQSELFQLVVEVVYALGLDSTPGEVKADLRRRILSGNIAALHGVITEAQARLSAEEAALEKAAEAPPDAAKILEEVWATLPPRGSARTFAIRKLADERGVPPKEMMDAATRKHRAEDAAHLTQRTLPIVRTVPKEREGS